MGWFNHQPRCIYFPYFRWVKLVATSRLGPLTGSIPPEVSAFRAELKLGDFGWAAIAAPEGKVSKPPPTGEKPLEVSGFVAACCFELFVGEIFSPLKGW